MNENTDKTSQPVVIPLSEMLKNARIFLEEAISQIMGETKLPLYLMDVVISSVLCDLRKKELLENGPSVMKKENNNGEH